MRLRWWEGVLAAMLFLLALLFLLGGERVAGVVLTALLVLVIASRVRIVERQEAGAFARARARLEFAQTAALLVIYIVIVGFFVIFHLDDWTDDTRGTVAMFALAGLAYFVYRELDARGDSALNWLFGSRAEERVGAELEPLREAGWTVIHNLLKDRGGNVDHVVWGPNGAYAIETKSGRFRRGDLPRAAADAAWTKEKLGARWVNAVLCVAEEQSEPRRHGVVWVVGVDRLREWLLERPREHSGLEMTNRSVSSE